MKRNKHFLKVCTYSVGLHFTKKGLINYSWLTVSLAQSLSKYLHLFTSNHTGTLAWEIPWTEEPGGLQSMGSCKSRTRLSDFTFTHWRRKWQPTAVFLPGESQGRGSLVGCRLWGCTESDRTEAT